MCLMPSFWPTSPWDRVTLWYAVTRPQRVDRHVPLFTSTAVNVMMCASSLIQALFVVAPLCSICQTQDTHHCGGAKYRHVWCLVRLRSRSVPWMLLHRSASELTSTSSTSEMR